MLLTVGTSLLPEAMLVEIEELLPEAFHKLSLLKNKTCTGAEYTGWWEWPEKGGFDELRKIRTAVQRIEVPFDLVVLIGIGGSYAGTKAVVEALRHNYADWMIHAPQHYLPIVYAGNNLSERGMLELLELMEEHEPIVNVISKSGGTIEPNVAFRIIEESLRKRFGKESAKRILVTTQNDKNPLCELAEKRGYSLFPIPRDVGGRYSILTAAGLLPLTLAGYDAEQLLAGGDMFFSSVRDITSPQHPVLQYACFRKVAWEMGKKLDILAYREPKLAALTEWWKQLFGESEGKDGKGLMPMGMSYTTDLHSIGQYLQEGPSTMIETFLNVGPTAALVEKRVKVPVDELGDNKAMRFLFNRYLGELDEAAWQASQKAHAHRGVPCLELNLSKLDEYHLGYLMAFFQTACAVSGLLLEVNPFDQPGVEVYKKELYKLLGREGTHVG